MHRVGFLLSNVYQHRIHVCLALRQSLRPQQDFVVSPATRKHFAYINKAKLRIRQCRHDKIGQQVSDAVAGVHLVEGVAVVCERFRSSNSLKHVSNDFQKYTEQVYGGNVLARSAQLLRLISTP